MVTVTGTATNAGDLFTKLIAFLTTNATLVGLGQNWSSGWTGGGGNERVLIGPGLSGTNQIYVGLRLYSNVSADEYWVELKGMTGIIPTGVALEDHINVQPNPALFFLDGAAMNYWFVANDQLIQYSGTVVPTAGLRSLVMVSS